MTSQAPGTQTKEDTVLCSRSSQYGNTQMMATRQPAKCYIRQYLGEHQTETQFSVDGGYRWFPRSPNHISEDEQEFAKE